MKRGGAAIPDFEKKSIKAFLDELGSASVSPGGGSAAALTAAIGVALAEMTARLNQKRLKEKGGDSSKRIAALQKARRSLTRTITSDVKVFTKISKLYSKKGSPKLEKALKDGASVPLFICRLCGEASDLAFMEKDRTSRWLASDLIEAALLFETAFESARLNVEINLKSISDASFKSAVASELDGLEASIKERKNTILSTLQK